MMKRALFIFLKVLRYGLIGLFVLLVLAVLILLEENQRGKWAWEKYKREAEARGMGFDPRPFIPPPVPDDQNFAMTPLLKPLFGADSDNYKTALSKRLKLTGTSADGKQPGFGKMWDGKNTDLAKRKEYLGQPDLLQALKKFDPELDEISTAVRRPYARFPIRYEDGVSAKMPHLTVLMPLTKIYALRALAELEAGQPDRAFGDVESIFGILDSFANEPLLISQLVRVSLLPIGLQVLWEGLEKHQWSESQLAALQGRLERMDVLTSAYRAIRYEQAAFPQGLTKQLNDPQEFAKFYSMTLLLLEDGSLSICHGADNPTLLSECFRFFFKNVFYQNLLAAGQFGEEYLFLSIDPAKQRVDVSRIKKGVMEIATQRGSFNPYTVFQRLGSPSILSLFSKFAYAQTTVNEAVIACALERYRLAHGEFPDKLNALVPQYLAKLPHDIINGEPLHYRRTDDGLFVLYSVGWNETDDNGTVGMSNPESNYRAQDIKQGDWVWRYPAPAGK